MAILAEIRKIRVCSVCGQPSMRRARFAAALFPFPNSNRFGRLSPEKPLPQPRTGFSPCQQGEATLLQSPEQYLSRRHEYDAKRRTECRRAGSPKSSDPATRGPEARGRRVSNFTTVTRTIPFPQARVRRKAAHGMPESGAPEKQRFRNAGTRGPWSKGKQLYYSPIPFSQA